MLERLAKDTSVVAPDGTVITIPYYEIGNFFENIVNEFIHNSQQNEEVFLTFQKEYHYFKPYFDFSILHLGYKIQNPFVFRKSVLMAEKEYLLENITNLRDKKYLKASDSNYNIKKVGVDDIQTSLISPLGIQFTVNREFNINHIELAEIYLLETMIYSKNLYEDYIQCMMDPDLQYAYPNIERYFRGRLGFIQTVVYEDKSGFIIYNKSLINDFMISFLNGVKGYYPNLICEDYETLEFYLQNDQIEKAKRIKQDVGEKYESRRF